MTEPSQKPIEFFMGQPLDRHERLAEEFRHRLDRHEGQVRRKEIMLREHFEQACEIFGAKPSEPFWRLFRALVGQDAIEELHSTVLVATIYTAHPLLSAVGSYRFPATVISRLDQIGHEYGNLGEYLLHVEHFGLDDLCRSIGLRTPTMIGGLVDRAVHLRGCNDYICRPRQRSHNHLHMTEAFADVVGLFWTPREEQ